jgi:hypothetical protein
MPPTRCASWDESADESLHSPGLEPDEDCVDEDDADEEGVSENLNLDTELAGLDF